MSVLLDASFTKSTAHYLGGQHALAIQSSSAFPGRPISCTYPPISYRKLLAGDRDEAAQVLEAARTYGIFSVPEGEALLTESQQLHGLAKDAFSAPATGTVKTTDKDQRPDTVEFFNISKDDLHVVTPSRSYPPQRMRQWPLLQSFTRRGHECGMVILRALAEQLGLQPDEFTNLSLFDRPSGDHRRLTHKTPHSSDRANAVGLPSPTDFGSVTVLFNWSGGLQVESNTEGKMPTQILAKTR
ncbi:Mugineic-acid 3-dioxygenase [Madurella mycetomatis]|uniref:Mugineic-acid 3-dioxygenase n=1 Tax=Madurella mycetomatis TaxID=100816 RepID=A0A175W755_9PEZI|nr:Mugineic-acid 3-dioxygenase [Madurella mycetomatis]